MESTATSPAVVDAELIEENNKLVGRADWTPETFRLQVDREKQLRGILAEYMQSAMIEDHHYYSFKKGDKPALSQEGAHSICSLLKQTFGPPDIVKEFDGDHMTVTARIQVFSVETGMLSATGDGMCSTRESKYAYRWAWKNELPVGIDTSTLKTRGKAENPQYQLPNQDLPDLYNTVLKMAVKRAKVAAVRQLPLVSELFVAEPDDLDHEPEATTAKVAAPAGKPATAPQASAVPEAIKNASNMATRLVMEHGVAIDDLAVQFLPEGIARFDDLTEEQAKAALPGLSQLLTAKLKEKK